MKMRPRIITGSLGTLDVVAGVLTRTGVGRVGPLHGGTRATPAHIRPGRTALLLLATAGAFAFCIQSIEARPSVFVASFGNNANDGSRATPMRTFQAAHDAVDPGGEIIAVDTAEYSALSITKSVNLRMPEGVAGLITTSGSSSGVTVDAPAALVTLTGLLVHATNSSNAAGILVNNVATLNVSRCTVTGYTNGISCTLSAEATIAISDSTLRRNSGSGILVPSFASASTHLVITGCDLAFNLTGVNVVISGTEGVGHQLEMHDTLISGNTNDGVALSGRANRATIQHCTISGGGNGIRAGIGASVKVDGCNITDNSTGLVVSGFATKLLSRGNNTLLDNATDGAFTGSYSAK